MATGIFIQGIEDDVSFEILKSVKEFLEQQGLPVIIRDSYRDFLDSESRFRYEDDEIALHGDNYDKFMKLTNRQKRRIVSEGSDMLFNRDIMDTDYIDEVLFDNFVEECDNIVPFMFKEKEKILYNDRECFVMAYNEDLCSCKVKNAIGDNKYNFIKDLVYYIKYGNDLKEIEKNISEGKENWYDEKVPWYKIDYSEKHLIEMEIKDSMEYLERGLFSIITKIDKAKFVPFPENPEEKKEESLFSVIFDKERVIRINNTEFLCNKINFCGGYIIGIESKLNKFDAFKEVTTINGNSSVTNLECVLFQKNVLEEIINEFFGIKNFSIIGTLI